MAVYANVKCKVFIHNANDGLEEDGSTGTMARDIKDYVVTLDSTNNKVLSISHVQLRGDRVLTVVIGGA
jgi:hypothetical protein|tara:strand:- start:39 stop:245 length:207 start_codon:yes stop_codon:yes gene_type:complete